MVIECESCGTRFNLADGQVPAQGARVRCSKCHHRFHVMPPGAEAPAAAAPADDSGGMPELPADDTPAPAAAATASAEEPPGEESFEVEVEEEDDEEVMGVDTAPSAPSTGAPDPGPPAAQAPPAPGPSAPPGGSDDLDLDNPEFLFDGTAESEPGLDAGYELAAPGGADELTAPDPEHETSPSLGTDDDAEHVRAQAFGISPSAAAERLEAAADAVALGSGDGDEAAPPPLQEPDPWALDSDSDDDSWASVLGPEGSAAGSAPQAAGSGPDAGAARDSARRERPTAPTELELGSTSQRAAQTALRAASLAVGLLLLLGGVRVLITHGMGAAPGPEVIRANGWTASQIDAAQLRDASGGRVLVLRGTLTPEEGSRPPQIAVTLLDVVGNPLEAPALAHLERLDASVLDAAALSSWLERGQVGRPTPYPIKGFTLLVPDPPPEATRFRLDLLPQSES